MRILFRVIFLTVLYPLISNGNDLNNNKVIFNIIGDIYNSPCVVDSGSSKNVNLGTYSSSDFTQSGMISDLIPFYIKLNSCPELYENIKIKFTGDKESTDETLLATNGKALNVGIALYDSDKKTQIPINSESSKKKVITTGENTFLFYAAYKATGQVSPGDANGTMTFTLSYN